MSVVVYILYSGSYVFWSFQVWWWEDSYRVVATRCSEKVLTSQSPSEPSLRVRSHSMAGNVDWGPRQQMLILSRYPHCSDNPCESIFESRWWFRAILLIYVVAGHTYNMIFKSKWGIIHTRSFGLIISLNRSYSKPRNSKDVCSHLIFLYFSL